MDRLSFNENETRNGVPTLDEVVLSNASVHLEQLDDHIFMLIVENEEHHWHLRIGARSQRSEVDAWVLERFDGAEQMKWCKR